MKASLELKIHAIFRLEIFFLNFAVVLSFSSQFKSHIFYFCLPYIYHANTWLNLRQYAVLEISSLSVNLVMTKSLQRGHLLQYANCKPFSLITGAKVSARHVKDTSYNCLPNLHYLDSRCIRLDQPQTWLKGLLIQLLWNKTFSTQIQHTALYPHSSFPSILFENKLKSFNEVSSYVFEIKLWKLSICLWINFNLFSALQTVSSAEHYY